MLVCYRTGYIADDSLCSTDHRGRECADTIGTVSVPVLAISIAKIVIYIFSNKIYGSNFIQQHSETILGRNYQNAGCSSRKQFYRVIYCNFSAHFRSLNPPRRRWLARQSAIVNCQWVDLVVCRGVYGLRLRSSIFWRRACVYSKIFRHFTLTKL